MQMPNDWQQMVYTDATVVNSRVHLAKGKSYSFLDMASVDPSARCALASESRPFTGGGSRFALGDTLLARITPCLENGKIARYCGPGKEAHGSTEFIVIRGRDNVTDSGYVYYLTRWERVRGYAISQMTGTSGRQRVSTEALSNLIVPVPPLPEQRRIAHILGTLDDKIENNRKTAKTLEAVAQAIFKSWFVDFDPVRAKMAGESRESICQRLKLTPEILDLFPDRLVDSELGEIPEGWVATTLKSITKFIKRGISPSYSDGYGILVLNQKCIRGFLIDISKARRHDLDARNTDGILLEVGDVLVNSTGVGTLGRVAQVLYIQEKTIIDSHVTLVRPDKKYSWTYLGQLIMNLQPQIEEMGEGSTGQTELSRDKLANLPITLPTTSILEMHHKTICQVKGLISDCERQIQILRNMRDALLPKLLSGKIRVSHDDVIVEEGRQ